MTFKEIVARLFLVLFTFLLHVFLFSLVIGNMDVASWTEFQRVAAFLGGVSSAVAIASFPWRF